MKDDPVKFLFKGGLMSFSIFAHPVNAYIDFGFHAIRISQVKSDYIGIKIVFKKIAVDFEDGLITRKYIIQRNQL